MNLDQLGKEWISPSFLLGTAEIAKGRGYYKLEKTGEKVACYLSFEDPEIVHELHIYGVQSIHIILGCFSDIIEQNHIWGQSTK